MNIDKQMLEDVVMVEKLLEETELPDVVLEETDKKKIPCYKFSAHQTIKDQEFLHLLLAKVYKFSSQAGAVEYLSLFLTDEFFNLLVEQTNLYAAQYKTSNPNFPPNLRASSWVHTTRNEIKKSLARSFLVGVVKKPEVSYHWSANPLLKGFIFNCVMPRKRFQLILQFLHFVENSHCNDKMAQTVTGYTTSDLSFNTLFQSSRAFIYISEDHISFDEELL